MLIKILRLLSEIGLRSFMVFLSSRYFITKDVIYVHTSLGKVAVRPRTSDIKVLYSCIFEEYRYLDRIIPEGFTFYDFGGYTGYSALAAKIFLKPSIMHIFEPIKENFELAKINLKNFSGVSFHNQGVGSETKSIKMTAKRDEHWGWSELETNISSPEMWQIVSIVKPTTITVDKTVFNFAKFDIEGSEKCLLVGYNMNWLQDFDAILIEFHDNIVPGVSTQIVGKLSQKFSMRELGQEKILFIKKA